MYLTGLFGAMSLKTGLVTNQGERLLSPPSRNTDTSKKPNTLEITLLTYICEYRAVQTLQQLFIFPILQSHIKLFPLFIINGIVAAGNPSSSSIVQDIYHMSKLQEDEKSKDKAEVTIKVMGFLQTKGVLKIMY